MGDCCSKSHHVEYSSTAYRSDVGMPVDAKAIGSLHHLLVGIGIIFASFTTGYH